MGWVSWGGGGDGMIYGLKFSPSWLTFASSAGGCDFSPFSSPSSPLFFFAAGHSQLLDSDFRPTTDRSYAFWGKGMRRKRRRSDPFFPYFSFFWFFLFSSSSAVNCQLSPVSCFPRTPCSARLIPQRRECEIRQYCGGLRTRSRQYEIRLAWST